MGLSPDFDFHRSPLRSAHESTSRASTPRPSISPLSTASKPNRSPIATRDGLMSEVVLQEAAVANATSPAEADVGEHQDDDGSSSLSEPDDEQDDEFPPFNTMRDAEEEERPAVQPSLEVDSEAETERLDQTPHKARQHADSMGKTPSKLSQAATLEDALSDPPSPLPTGVGAASSTSTMETAGKRMPELVSTFLSTIPYMLPGKKRKRSDTVESSLTSADSDLGEPPRKMSHESPPAPETKQSEEDTVNDVPMEIPEQAIVDTPAEEETPAAPAVAKGPKGRKGKQKGKKPIKDTSVEEGAEESVDPGQTEQEPIEEAAAKTEEERRHKTEASSMFEDVTKKFTAFREQLYKERLASFDAELEQLQQPICVHPEYLRQVACVNARREKQIREANAYRRYKLEAMQQRTLGERSQLHSQYFQEIRRIREDVLYELGEDWHNIQRARRQQHQEQDEQYLYKFPTKKSAQIRDQAKYNQEVSVVSGIAKYVGFPAAPEVIFAEGDPLEDDLKAMKVSDDMAEGSTQQRLSMPKITRRVHQPTAHRQQPPQPAFYSPLHPVSTKDERMAHEQYIEQNAWAQPQRPFHTHHGTLNLTHTPDWAEPGIGSHASAARSLIRNLSSQNLHAVRTGSPFMTPLPQKRGPPPQGDQNSSAGTVAISSDPLEPPSSVAPAPPTVERLQQLQQSGGFQGSPLVVHKQRQRNGGGVPERERELTGFRNVSNISAVSGASTIDATPDSAERAKGQLPTAGSEGQSLPAVLRQEISAPQQVFHANPLHHHAHGEERSREAPAAIGFRPQQGPFGTPTPLSANLPSTAPG
jgi:hypothetical protein